MTSNDLSMLLHRDLTRLRDEISAYNTDAALWVIAPGILNSGGNLALHLCGNLRHFIGHILGKTSYSRDRDNEFAVKNLSREAILKEIEITITETVPVIHGLTDEQLTSTFPKEFNGMAQSTGYAMLHIFGHLSYHLGQVNYHRRITANL